MTHVPFRQVVATALQQLHSTVEHRPASIMVTELPRVTPMEGHYYDYCEGGKFEEANDSRLNSAQVSLQP